MIYVPVWKKYEYWFLVWLMLSCAWSHCPSEQYSTYHVFTSDAHLLCRRSCLAWLSYGNFVDLQSTAFVTATTATEVALYRCPSSPSSWQLSSRSSVESLNMLKWLLVQLLMHVLLTCKCVSLILRRRICYCVLILGELITHWNMCVMYCVEWVMYL